MIALLLKASLVIMILLAFYKIFLERESFFAANRIYLLSSLLLAASLPFLELPEIVENQGFLAAFMDDFVEKDISYTKAGVFQEERTPSGRSTDSLEEEPMESGSQEEKGVLNDSAVLVSENQPQKKGLGYWLIGLYFFGVGVLSLSLLYQMFQLFWKINKNEDRIEDKEFVLINMTGNIEPCSFFKYIFINPSIYDYPTYEQIIAHEKIHIRQLHSLDLLLAEVALIILWFNPFIWLLRKEVGKNIEYQTDDLMVQGKMDEKEGYQLNLVKIATYTKPLAITTNYNQSLIKQRILKLNSKKSNPYSYWKYSFIAPVLFMLLLFLNKPNPANAQDETSVSKAKKQENSENLKDSMLSVEGINPLSSKCTRLSLAIQEGNREEVIALLKTADPNCVEPNPHFISLSEIEHFKEVGHTPLGAAAKVGNLEIGQLLLEAGAEINFQDVYLQSPIMRAAEGGHLEFVKFLLNKGAEINIKSDNHGTALHRAALGGQLEMVRYLIAEGANIEAYTYFQGTPLNSAARKGHREIMDFLVEKGISINPPNEKEVSALLRAATRGDNHSIEYLLSKGAKIEPIGNERPVLYAAAQRGNTHSLDLLLQKGAEINLPSSEGTALIAAARYGHSETVEFLLDKGARIDMESGELGTALIAAAWEGHRETVEVLLSRGASIDLQTKRNCEVLYSAVHSEFNRTVFQSPKDVHSGRGVTALMAAVRQGHTETVKLLLSKGADVHLLNTDQGNALIAAARNGRFRIVELLLLKGAKIDLQHEEQGFALNGAARNNQIKTLERLLEKGADINALHDRHGSALIAAARNGALKSVKYLVSQGADIHLASEWEGNALMAAYRNRHQEVVDFLESKGAKLIQKE